MNHLETRPAPLVPTGTDMRSYPWFPLDVAEVTRGAWWLNATPSARGVMVTLMCEAWRQIPAASLPSDSRSLARLGHIPSKTGRLMAEIMSEWVLCSDGRIYHPTLAKNVIDILDNGKRMKQKTEAGRAKLAEKRASVTEDIIKEIRIEDIKEKNFVLKEKPGRLPKGWHPSEPDREHAVNLGLDVERTADEFRDYWIARAGKDGVKADWSAAWRGWCRRKADSDASKLAGPNTIRFL